MFDCAAVYGNEDRIGKVFQDAFAKGKVKREELFVMTKVWNDMHGKGDVLISCAKSLKDLQLDYVDIFFVHWPFRNYHEPGASGDYRHPDSKPFNVDEYMETWRQCERLVDMGLTRFIGMSNMTIPKLEAVLPNAGLSLLQLKWNCIQAFSNLSYLSTVLLVIYSQSVFVQLVRLQGLIVIKQKMILPI